MKLSIIHNVYHRNPYIIETIKLNLIALKTNNLDFQYIVFNDNGDKEIEEDIDEVINDVEYIYSDINFGKRQCTGGWLGAIPYIKGDYVQNIGQDDIMTESLYNMIFNIFDNEPDIMLVTTNGYKVTNKLELINILIVPHFYYEYRKPLNGFKMWFGIINDSVTTANNNFLASGTIYKTKLHELVGYPDIDNFVGAADFEYWSRILFYEHKCVYIPQPLWYYRMSEYSAGNEIIDGKPNRGYHQQQAIERIKQKYTELYNKKIRG